MSLLEVISTALPYLASFIFIAVIVFFEAIRLDAIELYRHRWWM